MSTVGDRLKEIRQKRKKTLEEVAEAIHSSPTSISKYESGTVKTIPQKKLEAIARYLDINPSWLLGYDDPESTQSIILSISEQMMIEDFRHLDQKYQDIIADFIHSLKEASHIPEKSEQLHL